MKSLPSLDGHFVLSSDISGLVLSDYKTVGSVVGKNDEGM